MCKSRLRIFLLSASQKLALIDYLESFPVGFLALFLKTLVQGQGFSGLVFNDSAYYTKGVSPITAFPVNICGLRGGYEA